MENTEEQVVEEQEVEQTIQDVPATPEGAEESATPHPTASDSQQESPQAVNLRNLRELKERAERERDDLLRKLSTIEAQSKKEEPPPPEDFTVAPDDLVEGKHLTRYDRKIKELEGQLKSYQEQSTANSVEAKLLSQYPDFEKVVTEENVRLFSTAHPELAKTINSSSDLYNKAVSAYTMIKKLGIKPQNTYDAERAKVHENATKPRSLASVSSQEGDSPLTKANAFADGLTEDLKKRLYKEMVDAAK